MTTGSIIHSPADPYDELFVRNWSGADGKYMVDGREKWNDFTLHQVWESFQYGQTTFPVSTISGNVLLTWDPVDEMKLQSKLVEKVRGHSFNLAVNAAQAHQLVDMVSTTILKFGRALRYLKHGDIASAARQLGITRTHSIRLRSRDVSGRWLELQYGWLPSLSDAYEAAKAFEALSQGRSARIVAIHGKAKKVDRSASPSTYSSEGNHFLVKKIVYEMSEELSFARSLGLTDPLSVVWEVIPYSFVVDWFLPIGDYLDNLSVIPKLQGRFLSTLYSRWDTRFTEAKAPFVVGTKRYGHGRDVTRQVLSGLTTQTPSFVNPLQALSGKRIANAIALFHQAIS